MGAPSLDLIGGRYTLERQLGSGGMGTIWVARDQHLERLVAIKVIGSAAPERADSVARFQREALTIAQLHHPNVVQIYEYGTDAAGTPFLVMELLNGEDLQRRLDRESKLSLPVASALIGQAARALDAAHAAGIVHRDLKPANLFLTRSDGDEVLKVLDFGVASTRHTRKGAAATLPEILIGTPHYMSPEQVFDPKGADHRSDLWSLGVVAYRLLTGTLPFEGESLGNVVLQVCSNALTPASQRAKDLPPGVDAFFERALSKDPTLRFQSAREFAAAFAALAEEAAGDRATKVLVVDDEPDLQALIRQRFRRHIREGRYEFVFAANGEVALEELRAHPDVAVICTDINMPRMDGLAFLQRVGEINPVPRVIMVSAYSDMANIRTAMNRGAFDFLVKPLDLRDLENTLEKTAQHVSEVRRAQRAARENAVLRMFVNSGIIDRLLPQVHVAGGAASETVEATVAFLDVHGFTRATGGANAAEAFAALNACFELIVPEVTARDGAVDKFDGDAVMAVFVGEGHLARALNACLAARQKLAESVGRAMDGAYVRDHGLSVGVDSGAVLRGSVGSRALGRLEYTVLGSTVNTAAQLRSLADRDEILVTDRLARTLDEGFAWESAGFRTVPGAEDPLTICRVVSGPRRGTIEPTVTSWPVNAASSESQGS